MRGGGPAEATHSGPRRRNRSTGATAAVAVVLVSAALAVVAALGSRFIRAQACPPPGGADAAAADVTKGIAAGPGFGDKLAVLDAANESALPITFWNTGVCPFAQRAWIALEEKQLPYQLVRVDLRAKPPDFVAAYASVHPSRDVRAKVPVVRLADGYTMIESDVITEFLNERFPDRGEKLMPESAERRAQVRLFAATFDQTLGAAAFAVLKVAGEELSRLLKVLEGHLQALDAFLKRYGSGGGPFLLGQAISLAEVHAAPFVQRMLVVLPHFKKVSLPAMCRRMGLHRLRSWLEAVAQRPSVVRTGRPAEEIIKAYERMYVDKGKEKEKEKAD